MKETLSVKEDKLSWANTLTEAAVGDAMGGETSIPGRLRRFYTNTYKSLDQFDQIWYELSYGKRDHDWQTCYIWAIILAAVVNARSAFCESKGQKEPPKEFVRGLIKEIRDYTKNLKALSR